MKSISLHCKGTLVEKWQYFLLGKDYVVNVSGVFDEQTFENTRLFQQYNNINVDGVVGNETFQKAMKLGFLLVETDIHNNADYVLPPTPAFRPSTPYLMKNHFGNFSFIEQPDQTLVITDNWVKENIVSIKIPDLQLENPLPDMQFNKKLAPKITALFDAWKDKNLLHLIKSIDATFELRYIKGHHGILSAHAYGIAMDINKNWNPIGHLPVYKNKIGSVRELVPIANQLGFYWGGHMKRSEGSHFEFARLNLLNK